MILGLMAGKCYLRRKKEEWAGGPLGRGSGEERPRADRGQEVQAKAGAEQCGTETLSVLRFLPSVLWTRVQEKGPKNPGNGVGSGPSLDGSKGPDLCWGTVRRLGPPHTPPSANVS